MAQTNRFICPSRASSVSRMHYKTKLIWISIVVSSTLQAFIYINLSKPNISPVIHDEANPQKHQRNVNFANTIEQTCSNNTPSLPHVRQSSTVSNPLTGLRGLFSLHTSTMQSINHATSFPRHQKINTSTSLYCNITQIHI